MVSRVLHSVLLSLTLVALCDAQTFRGGISGIVQDSSGAVIAEAVVKAVNPATGYSRTALTSGAGDFSLPDLPLGQYTVTVSKAGFQEQRAEKVEVAVSRIANLNFSISPAQQASVVEVAAAAVMIESVGTALNGVVSNKVVEDLPLNGRDFRQMLKLAPGVTPNGGQAVNGNRTRGNNFQIDGADNNDGFQNNSAVNQGGVAGIAGTLLPVEAIDQFSVQTNGSAETGRNGGGTVNLVIKSGSNSLHGSAYYFNRNEHFAAQTPFAAAGAPVRKIRNNQYGFSLGGPIIKNRTFFFVTGEAQDAVAANSQLVTVPSDAWVARARQVLADNNIPVNPVSLNLLSFYPAATRSAPATNNNFLGADTSTYNSYNGIIKIDHQISSKHNLSLRYFGGTGSQVALVDSTAPFLPYFQIAPSRMHNVSVVLNSVLSARMVNQLVLGTNYFFQTFNDYNTSYSPIAAGLNTGVTDPQLLGSPSIRITGFASASATQPSGRIDTTGHITDTLSYTVGRHQLKFGGEFRRAFLDIFYLTNKRGTIKFDGKGFAWPSNVDATVRPLADFLAGFVSPSAGATITRGETQRDYRQNTWDLFVHDTFQVTPRLNLNAGLRYSYFGPLYDTRSSISTFIPGTGLAVAGKDIDSLYPKDWNNFAPRVGFAFQPKQGGKTVIRGSYGVFFDLPAIAFFANNNAGNGAATGVNGNPVGSSPVYNLTVNGGFTLVPGAPIFGSATPAPPFGLFAVSQDFRTPYVQNFNLNVQREVARNTVLQAGYVGSLGHKLPLDRDINQAVPGAGSIQSRRPYNTIYPSYGAITDLESIGNSNYNALQVSVQQTLWHGFVSQVAYTYSHAIDNGSEARATIPANSFNLLAERGNAAFDTRHIFTGYLSYTLPALGRLPKRLVGGWQLNVLMTFHTGQPMDLRAGSDISGTGDSQDRVDYVYGVNPYAPISLVGTSRLYLNKAAFATPAAGTFGSLGRNVLFGPGFKSVDPSLFKTVGITERVSVQLRTEAFNIFNSYNYANPTTTLSSGNFGLIANTKNGSSAPGLGFGEPRNLQLAIKLLW